MLMYRNVFKKLYIEMICLKNDKQKSMARICHYQDFFIFELSLDLEKTTLDFESKVCFKKMNLLPRGIENPSPPPKCSVCFVCTLHTVEKNECGNSSDEMFRFLVYFPKRLVGLEITYSMFLTTSSCLM